MHSTNNVCQISKLIKTFQEYSKTLIKSKLSNYSLLVALSLSALFNAKNNTDLFFISKIWMKMNTNISKAHILVN